MNTNLNGTIGQKPLILLALLALAGCATKFEPTPLPADHPASVQAQEAPRTRTNRLLLTDEMTRRTNAQLARKDVPNSDFQNSGMSHDMGSMGGMDHAQMKGMDMSKHPAGVPASQPEGMDHSKMQGMTAPARGQAASPASKEAVEMEMKKTSDEMKKVSDELKAKTDAGNPTRKSSPNPSPSGQATAAYWTCVMHPEIHEAKPGQCPKCGMTLVKKEGTPQ